MPSGKRALGSGGNSSEKTPGCFLAKATWSSEYSGSLYAHGLALEFYAKTLNFRQAHNEVELIQVDHDERHPLNETVPPDGLES